MGLQSPTGNLYALRCSPSQTFPTPVTAWIDVIDPTTLALDGSVLWCRLRRTSTRMDHVISPSGTISWPDPRATVSAGWPGDAADGSPHDEHASWDSTAPTISLSASGVIAGIYGAGASDGALDGGHVLITSTTPWQSTSSLACLGNYIAVDNAGPTFVSGRLGVTYYDGESMNHAGDYTNPPTGQYTTGGAAHALSAFSDGSLAVAVRKQDAPVWARPDPGSKTLAVNASVGGLGASADKSNLYAALSGGGLVTVRRVINPFLPTSALTLTRW